ncbi:MAG: hypothetical protein KJO05_06235 [Bacteroidia bacterium]|nr:hypothetical protein [Bacteroidia bacterium]NNF29758.1 hypothetical protein [Flavobacteriaceae bacterium]MBT8274700.1 hypothetical protein [Bacteroidia bacterium]NNJ81335.1 hypothetical protein [Flavobacteriaceae bacterium]NNK55375.1 hypothetical protein [Flavobacteriaceae bacterium]
MKTTHFLKVFLLLIVLVAVTSCAPDGVNDKVYGFFYGVWHGICLPFAVIGKIFKMDVGIYAINNTGAWYWIGYLIGFLIIGGTVAAKKRR